MTLKELVDEALNKSDKFAEKYRFWTIKRQKAPTLEWLMPLLEEALGEDFVREAALAERSKTVN